MASSPIKPPVDIDDKRHIDIRQREFDEYVCGALDKQLSARKVEYLGGAEAPHLGLSSE